MGSVTSGLSRIPYGRAFALTWLPSTIPASCLMLLGIVVTPFLPILMTFSNFLTKSKTEFDNLNFSLSHRSHVSSVQVLGTVGSDTPGSGHDDAMNP